MPDYKVVLESGKVVTVRCDSIAEAWLIAQQNQPGDKVVAVLCGIN